MRQLSLITPSPLFHGGELAHGKRKSRRPLCTKRAVHLILKSRSANLYAKRIKIEQEARRLCAKFKIKAYSLAVNRDHIHFVLKFPGRESYKAFLRAFTGLLARQLGKGLWVLLPFTRVLAWGKDFRSVLAYLRKNREEAAGLIPYEPRKNWYRRHKKLAQAP